MPIIQQSDVPASCTSDVDVVLGIDEAGRGPVLGPMVYGCAYWPVAEEEVIAAYGFDDSKALSEEKRSSLFKKMDSCGRIGWMTHSLTAKEIGAAMLHRRPISLNVLSHDAAMSMLDAILARGVRVAAVFVDTVGDPQTYQTKLERAFNQGKEGGGGTAGRGWAISFTVSKKADSLFKCVSAASIAAKVERDRSIREWVFEEPALASVTPPSRDGSSSADASSAHVEEGDADEEDDIVRPRTSKKARTEDKPAAKGKGKGDAKDKDKDGAQEDAPAKPVHLHPSASGSGYPSDPSTKAWMAQHLDRVFGWPSVCRFSWAPARDALEANGVPCDWGDEEDEEAGGVPQAKMTSFFSASTTSSAPGAGKAAWMRKRNITPVLDI